VIDMALQLPAWLREVDSSLSTNSQFVLSGNIRDRVLTPGADGEPELTERVLDALWATLEGSGYEFFLTYDPVDGVRVHPDEEDRWLAAEATIGRKLAREGQAVTLDRLPELIGSVVHDEQRRAAVVIDYASRLAPDPTHLTPEQHSFFTFADKLAQEARQKRAASSQRVPLYNPVIWLVASERDLPSWLVTGNEGVRTTVVPLPDLGDRRVVAEFLAGSFADYDDADEEERAQLVERFTQQTEGMTLQSMVSIITLAVDRGLGMREIEDAARCHRVGVLDNPWKRQHLRERIAHGEERLRGRVIGQEDSIRKSLDIVMRSVTGLTGAHGSPYATRPRGVLFFAGPTGVGKTELAKALTELVFGDERAYTRFDMSEFSSEHTAARLIGAPPGYTGFDAGGELTNAVRERPFSLILFDEIEKADGRILDKFLQILEDGRLTDGRGATVYFSEAILVFTSNLGIYVNGPDGERVANVQPPPQMDRATAEQRIRDEIKRHFNVHLGRPELLNRLGDNIVVFDFIDADSGTRIFDLLVRNISRRVEREHKATLTFDPAARDQLLALALADLSHGGRGIGSVLENALVNPLARALFARMPEPGEELRVRDVHRNGRGYALELA
jgi:ATP-dependent Clp protease ATP-binding subunit ClpB